MFDTQAFFQAPAPETKISLGTSVISKIALTPPAASKVPVCLARWLSNPPESLESGVSKTGEGTVHVRRHPSRLMRGPDSRLPTADTRLSIPELPSALAYAIRCTRKPHESDGLGPWPCGTNSYLVCPSEDRVTVTVPLTAAQLYGTDHLGRPLSSHKLRGSISGRPAELGTCISLYPTQDESLADLDGLADRPKPRSGLGRPSA